MDPAAIRRTTGSNDPDWRPVRDGPPPVPGWPVAFRGSAAVAAGLVTPATLRGPRFARPLPDTYVDTPDPDLMLRSHAAYRYVEGRGVLAGYSAAEVLGASCGPRDGAAEVLVFRGGQRVHPGLRVTRTRPVPGETGDVLALRASAGLAETERVRALRGVRATTPLRTAWDLARSTDLDLVENVVAVDALSHVYCFSPDLLLHFAVHYRGARGNDRIADVLAHADRRSGSPMETRLRMLLVLGGLPRPQAQWPVPDEITRTAVWLDLAYPEHDVGIEYEGGDHLTPDGVRRDIGRYTRLVDKGWRIYRYTAHDIRRNPARIRSEITRALLRSRAP